MGLKKLLKKAVRFVRKQKDENPLVGIAIEAAEGAVEKKAGKVLGKLVK